MADDPNSEPAIEGVQRIEASRPCRRCGYELLGLSEDGVCPECSLPISESSADNTLAAADPAFLKKLSVGAWLFALGALVSVINFLAMMALSIVVGIVSPASLQQDSSFLAPLQLVAGLIGCAAAFVAIVGAWLLTERDPREHENTAVTLRTFARAGLIANLLFSPWGMNMFSGTGAGMFGGSSTYITVLIASGTVLTIAAVVGWAAYYRYLARLTRRIPAPRIAGQATLLSWAYALSVFLMYASSLVAMIVWQAGGQTVGQGGTVNALLAVVGLTTCFTSALFITFEVWGMIVHIVLAKKFQPMTADRS